MAVSAKTGILGPKTRICTKMLDSEAQLFRPIKTFQFSKHFSARPDFRDQKVRFGPKSGKQWFRFSDRTGTMRSREKPSFMGSCFAHFLFTGKIIKYFRPHVLFWKRGFAGRHFRCLEKCAQITAMDVLLLLLLLLRCCCWPRSVWLWFA